MAALRRSPWCALALGVLAVFAVQVLWSGLCSAPDIGWNDARLAPSLALARGLPIYALPDSAHQLGWMYGPVFPLWCLPIGFTDNATLGIVLACLWNSVTFLSAVALVLAAAGISRWRILFGLALTVALVVAVPGINGIFRAVHVDALCVALGLVACVAVHRAVLDGKLRWLTVAAASVVLACWTKQLAVGLVPALVIWLWREKRADLVRPFLMRCLVIGAAVSVIFALLFGPAELLFNVVIFPLKNPYAGQVSETLPALLADLFLNLWPCAGIALWTRWVLRTGAGAPLPAATQAMMRLLFLAALVQLPLGVMAALKAGGGGNSIHGEYYLIVGIVIGASHAWRGLSDQAEGSRSVRGLVLVMLTLAVCTRAVTTLVWVEVHRRSFKENYTIQPGEAQMEAAARQYPGQAYLPWNPAIMIITRRDVYPFDDALRSLARAGWSPSREKIRALVPRETIILYPDPAQSTFFLQYMTPPTTEPRRADPPR